MKKLGVVFTTMIATFLLLIGVYLAMHNIGDGAGRKSKQGQVVAVRGDVGVHDIGICFENDTRVYYINRGMQSGCNVDSLQEVLVGQEATVYYYDNIIHSDPYHIVKLTTAERVLYREE